MQAKQVIVVRRDLRMRKGKIGAQCAHASMKVFFDRKIKHDSKILLSIPVTEVMMDWVNGSFVKIVVYVDSEEELLKLYNNALSKKIPCSLVTDNGATEFNGVPTNTCIAVGPDRGEVVDSVTGGLPLY